MFPAVEIEILISELQHCECLAVLIIKILLVSGLLPWYASIAEHVMTRWVIPDLIILNQCLQWRGDQHVRRPVVFSIIGVNADSLFKHVAHFQQPQLRSRPGEGVIDKIEKQSQLRLLGQLAEVAYLPNLRFTEGSMLSRPLGEFSNALEGMLLNRFPLQVKIEQGDLNAQVFVMGFI